MNTIKVIITFETKPESSTQFAALLKQISHDLPKVSGCQGIRIFETNNQPHLFTLLEDWDSVAAHQIHIDKVVSSGAWANIAVHLAKDPVSHYCNEMDFSSNKSE